MPVSGCFTYNKKSKFGLGIDLAELATVDFGYAKNCKKLVEAKAGKRVILKECVLRRTSDHLNANLGYPVKTNSSRRCCSKTR